MPDRSADSPAGVLFWPGDGISLRRATVIFLLDGVRAGGNRSLDRVWILDRIIHGNRLRKYKVLGKGQSDVAGPDYLDRS